MSIAPSPTFATGLWVVGIAVWIVTVGAIVFELVGPAVAAAAMLAMIFATVRVAGRRWSR